VSYAQRAPNSSRKSLNDSSKDFGSYPRFAYARLRRLLGFSVLMLQPALEDLTGYRIQRCNLLEARIFAFSSSAEPPLSPPFHPHSYVSDFCSVPVGCSRFIRCCHLISVLFPTLMVEIGRRHLSQSPKLGGRARLFGTTFSCSLCHCAHQLLAIVQRFVDLSIHPEPM
jgi:hypothetical protein